MLVTERGASFEDLRDLEMPEVIVGDDFVPRRPGEGGRVLRGGHVHQRLGVASRTGDGDLRAAHPGVEGVRRPGDRAVLSHGRSPDSRQVQLTFHGSFSFPTSSTPLRGCYGEQREELSEE